jgi:hypothetical protein
MTTSVKWNGNEIRNPLVRTIAATAALITGIGLGACAIVFWVAIIVLLSPLHPLFRLFGRKGFYRGNGEFTVSGSSFERATCP